MAPPKFVAPLRKNGCGSSFSISSASTLGSDDGKPLAAAKPTPLVALSASYQAVQSSNNNASESCKSKPIEPSRILNQDASDSQTPAAKPLNQESSDSSKLKPADIAIKNASPDLDLGTSENTEPSRNNLKGDNQTGYKDLGTSKSSLEPPFKKQKVESTASSSHKSKIGTLESTDDKENVNPKRSKKAQKDTPKLPFVSYTDEEYELIFQAVLANRHGDGSEGVIIRSTDEDPVSVKAEEESQDMFFSQSDLADSEGESDGAELPKKSHDVQVHVQGEKENHSQNHDGAACIESGLPTQSEEEQSLALSQTGCKTADKDGSSKTEECESGQRDSTSLSPCITFMCDTSQPDPDARIMSQSERMEENSKATELLHVKDVNALATSTPVSLELGSAVTLQNVAQKPVPASQEQSASLAISQIPQTPASALHKTLSATKVCLTSQSMKAPVSTPAISSTLLASQEPKTPCTPNRPSSSVLRTPQSSVSRAGSSVPSTPIRSSAFRASQEPKTPVRTPSKPSSVLQTPQSSIPRAVEGGSPAPSTPGSSQQFSQGIQLTPPPSGKTAKERLLWLQNKRMRGVWVQCEKEQCGKWRYLPDTHDPTTLPSKWDCTMHPDDEFNHCDAEEKRLSLHAEEDMIFNKYCPGSLVWAKLPGYPWWPAMVEDDPDLEQFYWLNLFSDIPTWYHVVFFDDDGRSSQSRAWVQVERLKDFGQEPLEDYSPETVGYKKRVAAAHKKARYAQQLSVKDRLDELSFASCYKGPIGGPPKIKYDGPLGYRKRMAN